MAICLAKTTLGKKYKEKAFEELDRKKVRDIFFFVRDFDIGLISNPIFKSNGVFFFLFFSGDGGGVERCELLSNFLRLINYCIL